MTGFAAAFGTYCGAGPILVGTDTRPSGEMVKRAAIAGLLSVGCTPVDVGVVPVPALMLHVREAGAFGGIAVSESHGPLEWTALRFISSEGLTLRANQAAELTDLYHQGSYPRVRAADMSGWGRLGGACESRSGRVSCFSAWILPWGGFFGIRNR